MKLLPPNHADLKLGAAGVFTAEEGRRFYLALLLMAAGAAYLLPAPGAEEESRRLFLR